MDDGSGRSSPCLSKDAEFMPPGILKDLLEVMEQVISERDGDYGSPMTLF